MKTDQQTKTDPLTSIPHKGMQTFRVLFPNGESLRIDADLMCNLRKGIIFYNYEPDNSVTEFASFFPPAIAGIICEGPVKPKPLHSDVKPPTVRYMR